MMRVQAEFYQAVDAFLDSPGALPYEADTINTALDVSADASVGDFGGAVLRASGHEDKQLGKLAESESDVPAAADGGRGTVGPPGGRGGNGRDTQYGGGSEFGDGDDHDEREEHQPERPDTAKSLGAKALEVEDPRTEAARQLPQRVAEIEALRDEADRYKDCATKPNPFAARPAGSRKPNFAHMSTGCEDMTALVERIKVDPDWGGPMVLYPKERLITSAHKATTTQLKAVSDQLKTVSRGLACDVEHAQAALDQDDIHRVSLAELEDLQTKLAQAARDMPSTETVEAIVKAYNWLIGVKGERANERPELGITANYLPRKMRYNAHVGPVITSRDRALGMAEARSGVVEVAGEIHKELRGLAERDELTTRTALLEMLEAAKREITTEGLQAAVREGRPDAGRLVAAESFVISQATATIAAIERQSPDFLKDAKVAPRAAELKRPVLAGIADEARVAYETELTENLSRDVTRARAIMTGVKRVLGTFGNVQRKGLTQTAELLDALTGGLLTRAEAGLLLAMVGDPNRLADFRTTVERVHTAAEGDEALQVVGRVRDRAIAELRQVDADVLVGGLRDKLAIARTQDLLSVALTNEQQRQARIAVGRYFEPEYNESPLEDDETDAEPSTEVDLSDEQLAAEVALVAADADLLDKITIAVDPEEGLLEIMDALGLDISGDEIDVVLDWVNREIQYSDQPVDVEALLLGMLGELEAARLDAASVLEIEPPLEGGPASEAGEEPQSIESVVASYEQLGFTVFPVGAQAFAEAQNIEDEAKIYDPKARIDINRVRAMVQFARAWEARQQQAGIPEGHRHMFIARGQLGNRGMVRTEEGMRARNEYLVLVMLQADEQGHIRQQCWADSPITRRNAAYVWDSEAAQLPFPNWERIYAGTKQVARHVGRARQLKHTAPSDADVNVTMMQRVWSLLTGPPEEFYRDTWLL